MIKNALLILGLGTALASPLSASAGPRVSVGIGIGLPGYYHYGPGYYGHPGYYYGPSYYYAPGYYYGPRYYYPGPGPVIVEAPSETTVVTTPGGPPPAANWYYCAASQSYYPYVKECADGWTTVPAQPAPAAAPLPAATSTPAPAEAPGHMVFRLGDLLFAPGSDALMPGAEASLRALLSSINRNSYTRVTVEGHTDSSGDHEHNVALSQHRAEAVRQYLIAHGVPGERIVTVGLGDADPIASNDDAEGRQLNRRVDVIVS